MKRSRITLSLFGLSTIAAASAMLSVRQADAEPLGIRCSSVDGDGSETGGSSVQQSVETSQQEGTGLAKPQEQQDQAGQEQRQQQADNTGITAELEQGQQQVQDAGGSQGAPQAEKTDVDQGAAEAQQT